MIEEYDRGEVSKFNPAQHKMNRINFLSQILNEAKMNPELWNLEWGTWNYNVIFKVNYILYQEFSNKFLDDEKKECEDFRIAIEECMNKYPLQRKTGRNKWTKLNHEELRIFLRWIARYEEEVKEYQDKHGLDTPNMEDDMGL